MKNNTFTKSVVCLVFSVFFFFLSICNLDLFFSTNIIQLWPRLRTNVKNCPFGYPTLWGGVVLIYWQNYVIILRTSTVGRLGIYTRNWFGSWPGFCKGIRVTNKIIQLKGQWFIDIWQLLIVELCFGYYGSFPIPRHISSLKVLMSKPFRFHHRPFLVWGFHYSFIHYTWLSRTLPVIYIISSKHGNKNINYAISCNKTVNTIVRTCTKNNGAIKLRLLVDSGRVTHALVL